MNQANDLKPLMISGRTHTQILNDDFVSALGDKALSFLDISSGIDNETVMREVFLHREAN